MGWVDEPPRRAAKGLPCVGWYRVWLTLDGWVFRPSKCGVVLPDDEEFELIAMLPFLALGLRWPWGVLAQDSEKLARAEGHPWKSWFVRVL